VVVALALRVPLMTATDLWLDEAAGAIDALMPLREIPSLLPHDGLPPQRYVASHPPLYYLVVKAAFAVLGVSGFAARAVSVLAALLLVIVMARAAPRGVTQGGALVAGLVMAVHPLSLYYGVEAKYCVMQWLLTALVLTGLARATARGLALAAIAQVALLYTQNLGVLLAPCWLVALLFETGRARLHVVTAGAVAFGAWLPWALFVVPAQLRVQSGGDNFKAVLLNDTGHIERLLISARSLAGAPPFPEWMRTLAWVEARPWTWLALALLAAVALTIVEAVRGLRAIATGDEAHARTRTTALLLCALASTWLALWLIDFVAPLFLPARYETPALVPLVWLAVLAWRSTTGRAFLATAMVGLVTGAASFVAQPESHRQRELLGDLGAQGAQADDVVVAGLAWAPLQMAAIDALGFGTQLRPFPAALRQSAGEPATIRADAAAIDEEASALAAGRAGRTTFVVAAPNDRSLFDALDRAFTAAGCAGVQSTARQHALARYACPPVRP
ncbi:MAG: hypothetical protein A2138_20345, partial [Deltaproteobacteria bacterium RBG_16_71_12]